MFMEKRLAAQHEQRQAQRVTQRAVQPTHTATARGYPSHRLQDQTPPSPSPSPVELAGDASRLQPSRKRETPPLPNDVEWESRALSDARASAANLRASCTAGTDGPAPKQPRPAPLSESTRELLALHATKAATARRTSGPAKVASAASAFIAAHDAAKRRPRSPSSRSSSAPEPGLATPSSTTPAVGDKRAPQSLGDGEDTRTRGHARHVRFDHTADSQHADSVLRPGSSPDHRHPDLAVKYSYMHTCAGLHSLHYSWTVKLGMPCLATCEWNEDLAKICASLTGKPCYSDLEVLHLNDYPHTAVHFAGTPCQSFSENGYGDGTDTIGGSLFVMFGRLHGKRPWHKRPIFSISEMVPGVLKCADGTALKQLHRALEASGYVPYDYFLEALDYGACAQRARVFVVGIRRDVFEQLGPMPIPTPIPRDLAAQSARTAMGPATDGDTSHGLLASDFTPITSSSSKSRVAPRRVLATDDGDQNGVVHDVDWPAPTQRSLTAPGIRNSGLYLYRNEDGTTTIVEPTDAQALRLQGLPADAPHAGRWSIGNAVNGCMSEALGRAVKEYLTRWYTYLERGHSADTYASFALAADTNAYAASQSDAVTGVPDGCTWKMVDSGCTFTILTELARIINPRPCRIPITIGDGKVMYATHYGDALIETFDSEGGARRLTSRLSLHAPGASRDLLSQEQIISQNNLGLDIAPGGGGERSFYHPSGYSVPLLMHNGLSGIPVVDLPSAGGESSDVSMAGMAMPAHVATPAPDTDSAAQIAPSRPVSPMRSSASPRRRTSRTPSCTSTAAPEAQSVDSSAESHASSPSPQPPTVAPILETAAQPVPHSGGEARMACDSPSASGHTPHATPDASSSRSDPSSVDCPASSPVSPTPAPSPTTTPAMLLVKTPPRAVR